MLHQQVRLLIVSLGQRVGFRAGQRRALRHEE